MEKLKALLSEHGIDLSRFGNGKAKSLEHLLTEVESGEAELVVRNGQLVRRLAVLQINVFADVDGRHRLVEDRQEFADGRIRRRNLPTSLSEKIHHGENLVVAVGRALEEELGIQLFSIVSPFGETVEIVDSPSFPGLSSEYLLYRVDVRIDPTEYRPEGYCEKQPDKNNFFVWL